MIKFELTVGYMISLYNYQNKKRALTGLDITLHRNYSQGNRDKQTASLDRTDSTKGYVEGRTMNSQRYYHNEKRIFSRVFLGYV